MFISVKILSIDSSAANPMPIAKVNNMVTFLICPLVSSSIWEPKTTTAGSEKVIAAPRIKPTINNR